MEITDRTLFFVAIGLAVAALLIRGILKFFSSEKVVKKIKIVQEYVEIGLTALLMALVIRAFVIQAFKIPSSSMENTLLIGDHLLVNRFIFGFQIPVADKVVCRFRSPRRGEIFVFKYPQDPSRDFIKRCMGLPGDVVQMKDKKLYINGQLLDEPYAVHQDSSIHPQGVPSMSDEQGIRDNWGPLTVPPDKFFAIGDNRDKSLDSRFWGFVPYDYLKGTPFLIYWPLDRIRLVK